VPLLLRSLIRLGIPPLVVGALLACSPGRSEDKGVTDFDSDTLTGDDTEAVDDSEALPDVSYWGVAGVLVVDAEGLSPASSALELAQRGADACNVTASILTVTADVVLAEQEAEIASWWQIEVEPSVDPACPWLGPTELELGFGVSAPDLAPAADRAGLSSATAYGLYARPAAGGGPKLIGLAGTSAQLQGVEVADPTAAPPEGSYALHTLHGLPL
jgi:hypothetical protein